MNVKKNYLGSIVLDNIDNTLFYTNQLDRKKIVKPHRMLKMSSKILQYAEAMYCFYRYLKKKH